MTVVVDVVEVWGHEPGCLTPSGEPWWVGSGYALGGRLVLTAAHVVCPGDRPLATVQVRPLAGELAAASVVWHQRIEAGDVALVEVTDPGWVPVVRRRPVRWGRFVTTRPHQRFQATGYPEVQATSTRRDTEQAAGWINPWTTTKANRLALSVPDPPARVSASSSPWSGMSGAGVFCGGLLTGVVVQDPAGFDSHRLIATPASAFATDPEFMALVERHCGHRPRLEPVELDRLAVSAPAVDSPAALLRADLAPTWFRPRPELAELLGWCRSERAWSAWLLTGPGGQGKTRLAYHLANLMDREGWASVFVADTAEPADFKVLSEVIKPLLVVVDCAETRVSQLAHLTRQLRDPAHRVRLLLVARTAGGWQTDTSPHLAFLADLPGRELSPLETSAEGRRQAWTEAVHALAGALPAVEGYDNVDWPQFAAGLAAPSLAGDRYRTILSIHDDALNTLLRAPDIAGPERDVCPYPRLFRTEDARWFFGRARVTNELMGRLAARLEQARPLVLVGVPGSGKSSLLCAGLLPALSAGELLVPGSRTWPRLLLTPTEDPVGELAGQIARLAGVEPGVVRAELAANPEGFAATVRRALAVWAGGGKISGARVVLVVDQFEETFSRCTEDQDRQVFIRALCAAAGAADRALGSEPPALVVLGVRADLYDRCAAYPELRPALHDGQVVLGPMRSAELRDAIEGPAHAAGLTLEPGLVETLLHELGTGNGSDGTGAGAAALYNPAALPLLSHVLRATWEHRDGRTLTVAGYQATGGIRGAVATKAETLFQRLDPAGQQTARWLLLHIVGIGDGGLAHTRLHADRQTLIWKSPYRFSATLAVLDAFVGAQLITVDKDTVEITHRVLLRAWPRLRGWIDGYYAGWLTEAARRWDRDSRPDSALYRGGNLVVIQDWVQELDHRGDLGTLERDFLAASQALRAPQQQASDRGNALIAAIIGLVVLVCLLYLLYLSR